MTFEEIINAIKQLPQEQQNELHALLLNKGNTKNLNLETFVSNERFKSGHVCPICGGKNVVRNGHRPDGSQRFMCRDCHKSFAPTTNSIVASTKKDLEVWEKYISCMLQGLSVRKTAEICGMHYVTAFRWRHKILDALQKMADEVQLNGIVEVDETFFNLSYKGNHTHSSFVMPRTAHRRGGEIHLRGLSHEKVCVPCAVNRGGLSIAKISNLGRVSTQDIQNVFAGRIDEQSTLVTDKMNAYVKFAEINGLELIQLKNGRSKSGIYNIQHINNYHSRLKKFMNNFNGVATKYLNNYLIWHNFANYARETMTEKQNILLRFVMTETA